MNSSRTGTTRRETDRGLDRLSQRHIADVHDADDLEARRRERHQWRRAWRRRDGRSRFAPSADAGHRRHDNRPTALFDK
jgi:hypothetical protein